MVTAVAVERSAYRLDGYHVLVALFAAALVPTVTWWASVPSVTSGYPRVLVPRRRWLG